VTPSFSSASRLFAWILLLATLGTMGAAPTAAGRAVVLLTMDGVRWDYPGRDALPAFKAMADGGCSASRLTPPFPSLTFPSHATLATGVGPSKHGIVANAFFDRSLDRAFGDEPEASWLKAVPLWVLAERAGIKSAVCAWPCSRGPWNGVGPSYYRPYATGLRDADTVRWILDLLRRPPDERPGLLMAWTHGADAPGHKEGPDGEGVHRAMREADQLLATLRRGLAGLAPAVKVDLVVVSDHGMAASDRFVDLSKAVPKDGFFPYVATSGPLCNLYVQTEGQRRAVAAGLRKFPTDILSMTHTEASARFGYDGGQRTGDFVLLCPPPALFAGFSRKKASAPPKGMHGYDPMLEAMGGIFYAEGPDFSAGRRLEGVRAVDVAPTLCACLRIPPPPSAEGTSLLGPR
jgi:predicted AlkP superfamily pyrophosphatase or phosphodiesterase